MNKAQMKIASIMAILLSGISIYYGFEKHLRIHRIPGHRIDTGLFLLFVVVVPILLIGGLLFIRAKKKSEEW